MLYFDIIIVSLAGALISLDRTAVFQSMIAQPIITAPIIGLILGDLSIGITIGAALELLWVCALPLGSYIPPDENLAAILTTACTILGLRILNIDFSADYSHVYSFGVLNILIFIPIAYLGRISDKWIRNRNTQLSHDADNESEDIDLPKIEHENIKGLFTFLIVNLVTIMAILFITVNIPAMIYMFLPDIIIDALKLIYPLILIIGVVTVLFCNRSKKALTVFTASFLLVSMLLEAINVI